MKKRLQYVCCLLVTGSCFLCFAQTPDSSEVMELINAIPKVSLPCSVWNLLEDPDTTQAYSMEDFNRLELSKIVNPDWREYYKYIPVARLSLDESFYTVMIHQYYDESQYAILVNYSKSGEFIDKQEVAHDNSEGWLCVHSVINDKNNIKVETSDIYINDSEPKIEIYMVDDNGHFTLKQE